MAICDGDNQKLGLPSDTRERDAVYIVTTPQSISSTSRLRIEKHECYREMHALVFEEFEQPCISEPGHHSPRLICLDFRSTQCSPY